MTVTASPADVAPGTATGTPNGVSKGQSLLNAITDLTNRIAAVMQPQLIAALTNELGLAQIRAVDYFMQSFWVAADQVLAQMATAPTDLRVLPKAGDFYVTAQLAAIAARQTQVTAALAAGTPTLPSGDQSTQYTKAFPPPMKGYPLTLPDRVLYQLQSELVHYYMVTGILPASLILSTMSGVQTYPWNGYESNYTFYQQYLDGYY